MRLLIQLMSAEFQINNEMIGRNILAHTVAADAVSADQHGSKKKRHKAINTCLKKKLVCDVLRHKKKAGLVSMQDGIVGAYDKIPHPIMFPTLMSFVIPQHV